MQNRILLNNEQVYEFLTEAVYLPQTESKFHSRCFDGRYPNDLSLPALTLPGGDVGELALIYGAATEFAFDVDYDKTFQVISGIVGGVENLSYHSDSHGDCGHIANIKKDLKAYSLLPEQVEMLDKQLKMIGEKAVVLKGDHQEGAILIVKGEYGVLPQGRITTDLGEAHVQVFVYHQGLAEERRKILAKELVEKEAVTLFPGLDEEYLYEVLTDMSDIHLFETSKRLGHGLPLYSVQIESPSNIKIKELDFLT